MDTILKVIKHFEISNKEQGAKLTFSQRNNVIEDSGNSEHKRLLKTDFEQFIIACCNMIIEKMWKTPVKSNE